MPAKKKTTPIDEPIDAIVPPDKPVVPVPAPVPPAPLAPYAPPQPLPAGNGKPGMVTAIAVLTLISGILNIMLGLGVTVSLALSLVLLCIAPLGLLPVALGVYEIIYATKLLPDPIQRTQPSQTIAILEIVTILAGNILSAVVGILALVFYSDVTVKAYFAKINGQM